MEETVITAHPDDAGRAEALAFIVACQQDPATSTAYLGADPTGIEAELEGLDRPWLSGWRAVRTGGQSGGEIIAACTVDWDAEPSMAWIHGPWGTPGAVDRHGHALLAAIDRQVPAEITHLEVCGHVANTALASLADRLGWTATEVNFALVAPAARARAWTLPDAGPAPGVRLRRMVPADVGPVEPLHAAEFGAAYATAAQLASAYHTVVAEDGDGTLLGYAAGTLQDDGSAYVDFTAVDPAVRRRGLGRRLVVELVRVLLEAGRPELVHLTVRESRAAAHALYLSLGMRQDAALRGYRGARPVTAPVS
ncbi:GNAT family N-acetyltransferase [Citricoccus nitrophenolicus]|uniref:GNAT family N-acetyltransferase n=1 Tax=Citricoccus nitrophenolicus TaxID=863575 RepID=A0ABV0IEQ3_9MICC